MCTIEDVHAGEVHASVPNTQKSSALMAVSASGWKPAAGDGAGEAAGGRADGEDDADAVAVELGLVAVDEQPPSATAASVATITRLARWGIGTSGSDTQMRIVTSWNVRMRIRGTRWINAGA